MLWKRRGGKMVCPLRYSSSTILPSIYIFIFNMIELYEEIRFCFTSIRLKRAKVPHPRAINTTTMHRVG